MSTKLPSLRFKSTIPTAAKLVSLNQSKVVSPNGLIINMDAAKQKTGRRKGAHSSMLTAEEALKKYYDKMTALDEKCKYDVE